MPDTIPVHYNFSGVVDRFGSKYEYILFPINTIIIGAFFSLFAKQQRKKGEVVNEKIMLYTGAAILIFFTAISVYFMIKAILYDASAISMFNIDTIKFVSIAIGILLVVLGSIMPKINRNSLFGLRTKWSMANDKIWQNSQRFCGIASVICGFTMIIACVFVPGIWNIVLMTVVIIIWCTVSIIASYKYYMIDTAGNNNN